MLAVTAGRCRRVLGLPRAQSRSYGFAATAGEATGRCATGCCRVRQIPSYDHLCQSTNISLPKLTVVFIIITIINCTLSNFLIFIFKNRCGQLAFVLCLKFYFFYEK